jgi:hypothetical protein
MKTLSFSLVIFLAIAVCHAENEDLLINDFEGQISPAPEGILDIGNIGDSYIQIEAAANIKYSGQQSLKIIYYVMPQGFSWVMNAHGLHGKSDWLVEPEDIRWAEYNAISFYMYGYDSKIKLNFEIFDTNGEIWIFPIEDNFNGWKKIICPFNYFQPRKDWQPGQAITNSILDFPIKAFTFHFPPQTEKKGVVYFDCVGLTKK